MRKSRRAQPIFRPRRNSGMTRFTKASKIKPRVGPTWAQEVRQS
jgi:hypothetical protein